MWLPCAEGEELKALEEQVDAVWKKRMAEGDPVEAYLQRDKVGHLTCVLGSSVAAQNVTEPRRYQL
jgi:hypothetical protein